MHENNPLHTFTTAVHVSVVAFAMNARYPGQFPNCSERQTKRERGNRMTAAQRRKTARLCSEREKGWKLERNKYGKCERERERERERRLFAVLSDASSAPEHTVLSLSLREASRNTPLYNSPSYSLALSLSLSLSFTRFLSLFLQRSPEILSSSSLYLTVSRRVQALRSARTPPRANTGQRLLRVSPSRSIFTIFTSRPGTRLPISRLHGRKKRERAALPTLPRLPSTTDSSPRYYFSSSYPILLSSSLFFRFLRPLLLVFLPIVPLNRDGTITWNSQRWYEEYRSATIADTTVWQKINSTCVRQPRRRRRFIEP